MQIIVDESVTIENIEEEVGFAPSRFIPKQESKNPNAKNHIINLESKNFIDTYVEEMFTEYLKSLEPTLKKTKEFLEKTKAKIYFHIVFLEDDKTTPYSVGLEPDAIKVLADLDAYVFVD